MPSIAGLPIGNLPIATAPVIGDAVDVALGASFPAGSWSFKAPTAGYWKFILWGPGGSGVSAVGDSGAYAEVTRFMRADVAASIVVGSVGTDTTVTFADGKVVTAGAATGAGGGVGQGVATGGDLNLPGSAGGASGLGSGGGAPGTGSGGAGAPGVLPYRGGPGGNDTTSGHTPGGGAGIHIATGGEGLVLAAFVKP